MTAGTEPALSASEWLSGVNRGDSLIHVFSTNIGHHEVQGILNLHNLHNLHTYLLNMATFIVSNVMQIFISRSVVIKLSSDLHFDSSTYSRLKKKGVFPTFLIKARTEISRQVHSFIHKFIY